MWNPPASTIIEQPPAGHSFLRSGEIARPPPGRSVGRHLRVADLPLSPLSSLPLPASPSLSLCPSVCQPFASRPFPVLGLHFGLEAAAWQAASGAALTPKAAGQR